jgi:DNA replication protein DnaC
MFCNKFHNKGEKTMTQQTTVELTKSLKQLNLSGIMECLDSRIKEAVANQMSYSDFLSLLIEDEILTRFNRRYQRRYREAGFKGHKTIENFDFEFNPKINQKMVRELATCCFVREKRSAIIVGPCGTGKSHIAQALGHCAIKQNFKVLCTTQSKLSEVLQLAKITNTYSKKLSQLAKIPLLIIDDFGLKPLKHPQDEDLHDLIAERYEQSATIVTSNLAISEWQQAFPNKLLGAATIDRIAHDAYQLILDGNSYRSAKNKIKSSKKAG